MNDTLTEIKNHLQGNNSRVDKAKNQINDLEHKEAKNNPSEGQEEESPKQTIKQTNKQYIEDRVSSIWDNFRCSNILIIVMPGAEEKEQEIGNVFEKIMKIFPNLVRKLTCKSRKHRESQRRWMQRGPLQDTS